MSKQLFALLQIVVVSSVVNNEVFAAMPNLAQLWQLVSGYLIPNFQDGGLVLPGRQQFAVAVLLPNTWWLDFRYDPSENGDGETPVIDPNYPRSPPDPATYSNYLAARPDRGEHSETQILDRLGDLYNAYRANNNNQRPQALLLYSWIVPCIDCTDDIVDVFTSTPFYAIPTKVVAHTTHGGGSCSDCDVNYTENELIRAGIDFTKVYLSEELIEIANVMAKLMQDSRE